MWEKEIDGKVYLVHTKDACRIQLGKDSEEDYKLHPDRYED